MSRSAARSAAWAVTCLLAAPSPAWADGELHFHRRHACEKISDEWCLARSTQGGFSVELPMPFNDFMVSGETLTTGGKADAYTVGGVFRGAAKLSATCLHYVEGKPDPESFYAGLPKTTEGPKPFVHKGVTGRRVQMSEPGHHGDAVFFVGSTSTCMLIAEDFAKTPLPPELVERFLRSFTFPPGFAPTQGK